MRCMPLIEIRLRRVRSALRVLAALLLASISIGSHVLAETGLDVRTDFEGGSARNVSIDQTTRTIRFMPGGAPDRGWACWWYLRIDGTQPGQPISLILDASDLPTRNRSGERRGGEERRSRWAR